MIRSANHEDVPRLIELGVILHSTTSYASMAYNHAKAAAFLHGLIDSPNGVLFVSEQDGVIIGGMAGGLVDQWFNDDLIAYDYSLFVEPGKRQGFVAARLIAAFQAWAKMKGAKQIQMGIGTGVNIEGATRLYEYMGLRVTGPLLMQEL
ncbi:GNAT family N-acetyltransferase [Pseudomonas donghuensis]|uniref:GNAT family N-acetyltransferase n=1 Tax=Pseudomonas donghuensis TaxID=1163398 RepID=UPI0021606E31|nr:GNAT family N-acetyltransferase [Pseudomonas donghuensis]UVL22390.1 GNAT family N-acetyltransferase [Pseudomonas donghuensis]